MKQKAPWQSRHIPDEPGPENWWQVGNKTRMLYEALWPYRYEQDFVHSTIEKLRQIGALSSRVTDRRVAAEIDKRIADEREAYRVIRSYARDRLLDWPATGDYL